MKKIRLFIIAGISLIAAIGISMGSHAANKKPCTECTWTSSGSSQNSEGAYESLKKFKETNKSSILIHDEELHEQCSQGLCLYWYTVTYSTSGNCLRNGN